MPIDDDLPRPKPTLLQHPPLDRVDVADLRLYIEGLRAEIARAEAEIARKDGFRTAADSVFRKP